MELITKKEGWEYFILEQDVMRYKLEKNLDYYFTQFSDFYDVVQSFKTKINDNKDSKLDKKSFRLHFSSVDPIILLMLEFLGEIHQLKTKRTFSSINGIYYTDSGVYFKPK